MAWVTATIAKRRNWAPGLATLTLDTVLSGYTPGQFVNLGLEWDGRMCRRSYSVASPPNEPVEVYLAEVPEGELTPSLFRCEVGDTISLEPRPLGFFTLDRVPPTGTLWLLATGTGLGPYMAFLRSDKVWTQADRVVLVHGVREVAHLGYAEELRQLAEQRANAFQYVPVVSRQAPGDEGFPPTALPGRITEVLASQLLEKAVGLELVPSNNHVLLCGNPAMIEETQSLLEARGLAKHRVRKPGQITFESYW